MAPKSYMALNNPNMYPQIKFGITIFKNIGDMLQTVFSRTEARGQV